MVRAIFDTGSTNTWILNSKTDIKTPKPMSYDETKSSTFENFSPIKKADI